MQIEKTSITKELMRIDTRRQVIDMQQIDNRRFMYNPKTGILVLCYQYALQVQWFPAMPTNCRLPGSQKAMMILFRGWIGTGGDYPKGVIHFAPCVDKRNIMLFDQAFDTLKMFQESGALAGTVVRGFGERWEQPLSDIFTDMREPGQKPSVRRQLKKQPEAKASRRKPIINRNDRRRFI